MLASSVGKALPRALREWPRNQVEIGPRGKRPAPSWSSGVLERSPGAAAGLAHSLPPWVGEGW